MICRILLLISLTSCVSGTFEVKVTQTSYQAEENHNITLELMFPTKLDRSSTALNISCRLLTDDSDPVLYHVHQGVEVSESQDEQFAGRVQSDKDALREGRIRLHVSRLRTEDLGRYLCEVFTDYGVSSVIWHLNITGTFEVKLTQSSYQAEENHNITLEWMFTTKPDSSYTPIIVCCRLLDDHMNPLLYHLRGGVEYQDEQFAGRVQCDKDALREGRIRLHVYRLRTEDSGLYRCEVITDYGTSYDKFRLNVTAKSTATPTPGSRGSLGPHSSFILLLSYLFTSCVY